MSDSDDLGEELLDNLQLIRELKDEIAKATDGASQRVSRSFHGIGVFLAMFVLAVGVGAHHLGRWFVSGFGIVDWTSYRWSSAALSSA